MIEQLQPHRQFRMRRCHARQRGRDHLPPEAEAAADPQHAARQGRAGSHRLDQAVHVIQHTLRPAEHALAFFGDAHLARRAMQQLGAERGFQQPDALGHIGGGYAQFQRGSTKAGAAGDDDEDAQVIDGRTFVHEMGTIKPRLRQ